MKQKWSLGIILATIPAALGLIAWIALTGAGWLPDTVIYMRISGGKLLLILGCVLSLVAFGFLILAYEMDSRSNQQIHLAQVEAAKRRRQFLMRLDHELKNPLTTLQVEVANLDAIDNLSDSSPTQDQAQTQARIREQVARLNELVIQLRKLGELETRPIENEPVDLDELLHELVAEFQSAPPAAQREIDLSISTLPWPLPKVRGDADLLYLAFRNVVGNAVKFTGAEDSIQIRALEVSHGDKPHVIVEVADSGPGIPDEEQEHVWEELFRGKNARGTPGSGLGLALVKAIVERHGGQVTLRSRLKQGTVVTLRIPTHV
jgi:two-component system OmpR family sensor kinase